MSCQAQISFGALQFRDRCHRSASFFFLPSPAKSRAFWRSMPSFVIGEFPVTCCHSRNERPKPSTSCLNVKRRQFTGKIAGSFILRPRQGTLPPERNQRTLSVDFPPELDQNHGTHAACEAVFCEEYWNSVPSIHMQCMITASLRPTATLAHLKPLRRWILRPHAFSADHF